MQGYSGGYTSYIGRDQQGSQDPTDWKNTIILNSHGGSSMSQIKLLHSGGNGVILAAPTSNPAADRTLRLPGDADGTIATTAVLTAGKILQVKQTFKNDTASTNSGTYAAISGLTVSITPSSSSNKIL